MREGEKPLKVLINRMLRAYGLGDKIDEIDLIKKWEELVGPMIAKHTTEIYFRQKKLFIHLDSAPLRQELSYARQKLIKKLNESAGKELVEELILK
jgi:predicted nucleic acid-binding Zn ribbon protein